VPWATIVNDDGTFKSVDEIRKIYAEKRIDGSKPIITYCRIGERSSHSWFALRRILGYEARNYGGSWTEYGNAVGVPVENPAGTVWTGNRPLESSGAAEIIFAALTAPHQPSESAMNAVTQNSGGHPDPEQWRQVQSLAETLGPDQAVWLSGYFAGLGQSLRAFRGAEAVPSPAGMTPAAERRPATGSRTLTILYGTETGNSSELAEQIASRAGEVGLQARTADMASYKSRGLKDEQDLLLVTSTHGEGDPPEPAVDFFEFIQGRKAPKLAGTRYAVLGLGDSTYEFFCGASKTLDARLEELGAERLHARIDCDVDYEEPASDWIEEVLGRLAEKQSEPGSAAPIAPPAASATAQIPRHDKRNPFEAEVLDNLVLTGRGSSKETRHIELSLEGSGLSYEPGDALGIVPRNDPRVAEQLLMAAGLDGSAVIATKVGEVPLSQALESRFEICALTPGFIGHWAEIAGADALRGLVAPEKRSELAAFMRENHVIDVVRDYPAEGISATDLTAGLRRLQPRLYSIASSSSAAPDEVHLTVSAVRYQLRDEPRAGVASGLLAERLRDEDRLRVYVQSNPHFRLPEADDTPIIMIGAGTGIAPFRAFLQEREIRGNGGRSWLFFGERNFRTDFLYQTEWQGFLKDEVLTRMDVAFSRDQAEKVYVHHRLRERGRDLFAWLEEGAHVYVCGDANTLAPDVHGALTDIVAEASGLGGERAAEYVRDLQRAGRYQRDVY
jgi:sulfite reductase (NADPH) flavoprotein alpha-component